MIILQNLLTTNHRKSGKSKDDLKLSELDVVHDYASPVPCKRGLILPLHSILQYYKQLYPEQGHILEANRPEVECVLAKEKTGFQ